MKGIPLNQIKGLNIQTESAQTVATSQLKQRGITDVDVSKAYFGYNNKIVIPLAPGLDLRFELNRQKV